MKSEWKITSNIIGDTKMYAVYRLRDATKTDHSGNREYCCDWLDSREDAQVLADRLNQEGEHEAI